MEGKGKLMVRLKVEFLLLPRAPAPAPASATATAMGEAGIMSAHNENLGEVYSITILQDFFWAPLRLSSFT